MKTENTGTSFTRFRLALLLGTLALASQAQAAFTKADSGWVRLFNGTDFNGFYSRLYAQPVVHPVDTSAFSILYPGTDTACIRAKNTSKKGELGTDRANFSHYRTRMEYRFDVVQSNANAGLLYGVDETAIRMQNNWPRGFEFQMQQSEPGSVYSIQQVTATTRASGGAYNATGSTVQVCEYGCNARSYKGNPVIPSSAGGVSKWMRIELIQRGADSAIHIVNDTTVMRIWNIRIFNDSTRATGSTSSGQTSMSNFTPSGPYPRGALAIEGEGALINHRRWEVMEFPDSTPMNEHFLHRLFLDAPAARAKPAPGSQITFAWRSIGTIPKVKIQYRSGSGAWQTAVDSVPNTGSYAWTAPGSIPDTLNFRISSANYVWADSTVGKTPVSLYGAARNAKGPLFSVRGGELLLPGTQDFDRVEIRDASGKLIRSLRPAGNVELHWDLTNSRGMKVRSGLYFLQLTGAGAAQSARVMIF